LHLFIMYRLFSCRIAVGVQQPAYLQPEPD
jgi:hypothetical protein